MPLSLSACVLAALHARASMLAITARVKWQSAVALACWGQYARDHCQRVQHQHLCQADRDLRAALAVCAHGSHSFLKGPHRCRAAFYGCMGQASCRNSMPMLMFVCLRVLHLHEHVRVCVSLQAALV